MSEFDDDELDGPPLYATRQRRLRLIVIITIPAVILASLAGAFGVFGGDGYEPEPTPTPPQIRI